MNDSSALSLRRLPRDRPGYFASGKQGSLVAGRCGWANLRVGRFLCPPARAAARRARRAAGDPRCGRLWHGALIQLQYSPSRRRSAGRRLAHAPDSPTRKAAAPEICRQEAAANSPRVPRLYAPDSQVPYALLQSGGFFTCAIDVSRQVPAITYLEILETPLRELF